MCNRTLLLVGTAAMALASPALAQTNQEEIAQAANEDEESFGDVIVVTATKRATTVQDVPFSINAQTQEDIQRANAQTRKSATSFPGVCSPLGTLGLRTPHRPTVSAPA